MRACTVTLGGLPLLLSLLGGGFLAERLAAQTSEVSGSLVTHGPTLGALTLHPTACVAGRPVTFRRGIDLIDEAHIVTIRITPIPRHHEPQLWIQVAPAAGAGGGAKHSVEFLPGDCKMLQSHVDEETAGKDDERSNAYGRLELDCQLASGDGVTGKVEFRRCR